MRTAEEFPAALYPMSNHFAPALLADWGKLMDCALKAVENVPVTSRNNLETELVVITANFTDCHIGKTRLAQNKGGVTVINRKDQAASTAFLVPGACDL